MNGLLKEQVIKLGQGSYKNWRTNVNTALNILNNRPVGFNENDYTISTNS